jgi:hypothetical protein
MRQSPINRHRQDAKSPRQDEPRQGEAKPSEQSEDKTTRSEDKSGRGEDKSAPRDDAKSRGGREQGQAQNQSNDHAQGNMGRRGGHIPDDKFRASFGRQHTFKVQRLAVAEGQSTFQYGGYSFALIDVWPTGWAYTDDCYVDFIDGDYYLIDLVHPDIRLAIVVVL